MSGVPPVVGEAEALVARWAAHLAAVRPHECLCCYVARQLETCPCDGTHRHAERFRDDCAPRATALHDRLARVGACCCDCELFVNAYDLHPRHRVAAGADEAAALLADDGWPDDNDWPDATSVLEDDWPDELPPCRGVRRGSIRPCDNWVRLRRW